MSLCTERLEGEILRCGKTKSQISNEIGFDIDDVIKNKTIPLSLLSTIADAIGSDVDYLINKDATIKNKKNLIVFDIDLDIMKNRMEDIGWASPEKLSSLISSRYRFINAIIYNRVRRFDYYEIWNLCHYLKCSKEYLSGDSKELGQYPEYPINHSNRMILVNHTRIKNLMDANNISVDYMASKIKCSAYAIRDIVDGIDVFLPKTYISSIASKLNCEREYITTMDSTTDTAKPSALDDKIINKSESNSIIKNMIKDDKSINGTQYSYKNSGPRKLERAEKMLNLAIEDPECFGAVCKLIDASDECRKTVTKCINAILNI